MADEEKKEVQDPSPTSDDTKDKKSFLEGTYHGQKVAWDEDTARSLAQKGLDYETKLATVKAEKEELSSDADGFSKYKAWRNALSSDPRRAQAVARAFQDPDAVLAGGQQEGDDSDPPMRNAPVAVPAETLQLKSTVEQLQARIQDMTDAQASDTQKTRLERAVGSFSFLSSSDEKGLAMETAEGLMARNPEMTPEGAMSVAAEKLKGVIQGQNQSKLDKKEKAGEMKTVDPNEGTPAGASGDKKKKEVPYGTRRNSSLRGDVIKELTNGMFGDRFKGV